MTHSGSVLIVDQDPELVAIMSSYLTALGYRIIHTTRVREAIKKLNNQKFTFVFVDPELAPDSPDQLFTEMMQTGSLNHKTPLILTTFNTEYLIPMAAAKRIDSILVKPFTIQQLNNELTTKGQKRQVA